MRSPKTPSLRRRTPNRLALLTVLMLLAPGVPALADDAAPSISEVSAWLSGSWRFERNGRVIDETWLDGAGGTLLGVGRTLKGEHLEEFEFLRIESGGHGLVYLAQPGGAPPTEFRRVASAGRSLHFENPQHDFPQVIRYWSDDGDHLTAEISGRVNGAEQAIRFEYRRRPGSPPKP